MRQRVASQLLSAGVAVLAISFGVSAVLAATSPARKAGRTGMASQSGQARAGGSAGSALGFAFSASASTATIMAGHIELKCAPKAPAQASTATVALNTNLGQIGAVSDVTLTGCTGPAGGITVTPGNEPYPVNTDSAATSSGQADVIVSKVDVAVSATGCAFTVSGSATGYLTITKHTLAMTAKPVVKPTTAGRLTVSNVTGCFGIVENGDQATYSATYTLTPVT